MKKLALFFVLALSTSYAGTIADQVFYFTGTCGDCTGTGTATLTVVGSYVLGTDFQESDLVSFVYHSDLIDVTTLPTDRRFEDFHGIMPVGLGPADITVEGDYIFHSNSEGYWTVGVADYGADGVWSQPSTTGSVPEPSTWLTMGIGLAVLTKMRLRR